MLKGSCQRWTALCHLLIDQQVCWPGNQSLLYSSGFLQSFPVWLSVFSNPAPPEVPQKPAGVFIFIGAAWIVCNCSRSWISASGTEQSQRYSTRCKVWRAKWLSMHDCRRTQNIWLRDSPTRFHQIPCSLWLMFLIASGYFLTHISAELQHTSHVLALIVLFLFKLAQNTSRSAKKSVPSPRRFCFKSTAIKKPNISQFLIRADVLMWLDVSVFLLVVRETNLNVCGYRTFALCVFLLPPY